MRENALARLAVVHAAPTQVPADRHSNDNRRLERVGRAISQHRQLVANLHHRRPDVVEELDLDDRLQAAHRHADRTPDDVRLRERCIEHPVIPELPLQSVGGLEDTALAGHLVDDVALARIGDVLTEHHHQRVALHFVVQRAIDRRDHRHRLALRRWRRVELIGCGIDVG
jgi:hypothetical protein